MWTRTLVLSLSSLTILATSFCSHNPERKRDVSSTTLSNEFAGIEPLVVATDVGDQLLVYVKKHNSRSHAVLVELSCRSNDHEPVRWELLDVEIFSGISDLINGAEVVLQYKPRSILDFSNTKSKPTSQEIESSKLLQKRYNIPLGCKRLRH